VPRQSTLTADLGVFGWSALDPLLLAALTLESPVLLVGTHGTAKTLLVERVASALGQSFRHYNASLLNYDDLVGIPLPDEAGGLRFVGSAGAVWGAEFVFFDEVNRCRPDLQNKMFPLVHERRVAGVDLPALRHRWAAMNPPGTDDGVLPGGPYGGYLGTECLDAALADRFAFVITAPGWEQLSRADREALVASSVSGGGRTEQTTGQLDLPEMVSAAKERLCAVREQHADLVTRYVVLLVDLLRSADVVVSPRRAATLANAVLATFAASQVLNRVAALADVAESVVRNGLPHWADAEPPSMAQVIAAHVQAFETATDEEDSVKREILAEPNPLKRVKVGLRLSADEVMLATLCTTALAAQPSEAHRMGLATVFSRALADHALTPAAWSSIADLAVHVLEPREQVSMEAPGRRMEAWREASAWLATHDATTPLGALQAAFVTACGPELLADVNLKRLLQDFAAMCRLFGVEG